MPDYSPVTAITNLQVSAEVSYSLSTHNPISSNAGAVFYEALFQKYLYNISSPTLTSDGYKYILTTKGHESAQRVTSIINNYLKESSLSPAVRNWLSAILAPDQVIDSEPDKVVFVRQEGGRVIHCEYYMPLREVFATVILALNDRSEGVWPLLEGQRPRAARAARIQEFNETNKALAQEAAVLCQTGIRHSWLQTLNGYQKWHLPLGNADFLAEALRSYTINLLKKDLKITLPEDRDPRGSERQDFVAPFKTLFLPWLRQAETPLPVIKAFLAHGGSQALEQHLIGQYRQVGIIPDESMIKQIKDYASLAYFKTFSCDFIPFLATLQKWLSTNANFPLDNPRSSRDRLVVKIIQWLENDFNGTQVPTTSSNTSAVFDGMETFYLIDRLFETLDKLKQAQRFTTTALITNQATAQAYSRAIEFFSAYQSRLDSLLDFSRLDEISAHISAFDRGYVVCQRDNNDDFITHFFTRWFSGAVDGDDGEYFYVAARASLFISLSKLYFPEYDTVTGASSSNLAQIPAIFLDDDMLQTMRVESDALTVYQVNRILLHALCYNYEHWSPVFYEYLTKVLAFIRTDLNKDSKSAYPKPFLRQIDRLVAGFSLYKQGMISEAREYRFADEEQSHWPVLTPSLINSNESFRLIRYLVEIADVPESLIVRLVSKLNGFDVDACSSSGTPMLSYVSERNRPILARRLIAVGALPNQLDLFGETALSRASHEGNSEVVALLVKQKSDTNLASPRSYGPLHRAVQNGHLSIVEDLIRAGADVNAKGTLGSTPLHEAARNNHLEVVDSLIRNNAILSISDDAGNSPMDYALLHKNTGVICRLLEAGAPLDPGSIKALDELDTGRYQPAIQAILRFTSKMLNPQQKLPDDLRLAALSLGYKIIAVLMRGDPSLITSVQLTDRELEALTLNAFLPERKAFTVIDRVIPEPHRQQTRQEFYYRIPREPTFFERLTVPNSEINVQLERAAHELCSIM